MTGYHVAAMKAVREATRTPADTSIFRRGHTAASEALRQSAYRRTVDARRADHKRRFLSGYRRFATVALGCLSAGIESATFYKWRAEDPEFADAVRALDDEVTDGLTAEAQRRAMARSDTLLIFLLKSRRPEVYQEHREVTVDGGVTLSTINPDAIQRLTNEELAETRRIIGKLRGKPGEELG